MTFYATRILPMLPLLLLTATPGVGTNPRTVLHAGEPVVDLPTSRSPFRKTLGGRQFWGDVHHRGGWRIQKNVLTGHYRLLDQKDYRYESGTLTECRAALEELAGVKAIPQTTGPVVIMLHGILRSSKAFGRMSKSLREAGLTPVPFDYPSTRETIPEMVGYLRSTIASMTQATEIHFVCHSMGGLLVRAYLAENPDPRVGRIVMVGTPNHGANLADTFRCWPAFKLLFGPSGQQLVADPAGFIASLPTPDQEFGIIAGGKQNTIGYNPLIPGDDDSVVSVESTRLAGASDFVITRGMHSLLLQQRSVIDLATRYLCTGAFRTDGTKEPIR